MTPKEVQHWCDNERAVIGSSNDINSPKSMLGADADILLAIQHIRRSVSYTLRIGHVYGHQDTRTVKDKSQSVETRKKGILFDVATETNFNKPSLADSSSDEGSE